MSIIDQLIDAEKLSFYGWWQAITCFFAFLALMAIWWHLGRRKKDYSQICLAVSILCWSVTGIIEINFANLFENEAISLLRNLGNVDLLQTALSESQLEQYHYLSFKLDGYTSIFSLTNSFFILMALPWFRHIPKSIRSIIISKYWLVIIGLPFLFSILPTLSKVIFSKSYGMISELDFYYSILTLGFLGLVLWESFDKRRLKLLAWLSLICILITFAAQVYKITGSDLDMRLISAIFKSALIMIFFALALSWVKDLTESIIPTSENIFLLLKTETSSNGKILKTLQIKGIPSKAEVEIILGTAPFELLTSFINHKMDDDKWLEIKPKNEVRNNKEYPIKDYNEIKRLIHLLLDGIYGKGNWTKEQHEIALKETFFEVPEKRERKIRLKLPSTNVIVS